MTPMKILDDLRVRGVRLFRQGAKLKYEAPEGTLKPVDFALLKSRRTEILALIDVLRIAWPDGGWHVVQDSDGAVHTERAADMRRITYSIARARGFPPVKGFESGEPAWRAFCRDGDYCAVAEAGLAMDDVKRQSKEAA